MKQSGGPMITSRGRLRRVQDSPDVQRRVAGADNEPPTWRTHDSGHIVMVTSVVLK